MASIVDEAVQAQVTGGMAMEAAAAAGSRVRIFDQLAHNSSAIFTAMFVQPTMLGAEAIGVLNRTRNNPTPTITS